MSMETGIYHSDLVTTMLTFKLVSIVEGKVYINTVSLELLTNQPTALILGGSVPLEPGVFPPSHPQPGAAGVASRVRGEPAGQDDRVQPLRRRHCLLNIAPDVVQKTVLLFVVGFPVSSCLFVPLLLLRSPHTHC